MSQSTRPAWYVHRQGLRGFLTSDFRQNSILQRTAIGGWHSQFDGEKHLYMSSVEWHMQLMHWLPGKWRATEASRAAWYSADMAGPPTMPTVDWQSTLTPSMPAPALARTNHHIQQDRQ